MKQKNTYRTFQFENVVAWESEFRGTLSASEHPNVEKLYSKSHATKPSQGPFLADNEDMDEILHPARLLPSRRRCNSQT